MVPSLPAQKFRDLRMRSWLSSLLPLRPRSSARFIRQPSKKRRRASRRLSLLVVDPANGSLGEVVGEIVIVAGRHTDDRVVLSQERVILPRRRPGSRRSHRSPARRASDRTGRPGLAGRRASGATCRTRRWSSRCPEVSGRCSPRSWARSRRTRASPPRTRRCCRTRLRDRFVPDNRAVTGWASRAQ